MRVFEYLCDSCGRGSEKESREDVPIGSPLLCPCGKMARRVFSLPHVPPDSLSIDPDHVPDQYRVASNDGFGIGKAAARNREKAYQADIDKKRAMVRDGGNKGGLKMESSIPADLYWGKVRQTGDKGYWDNPKNRAKHRSVTL